jgi:hypothetical protein
MSDKWGHIEGYKDKGAWIEKMSTALEAKAKDIQFVMIDEKFKIILFVFIGLFHLFVYW